MVSEASIHQATCNCPRSYLSHLILLPGCKVGVLDVKARKGVGDSRRQSVICGCKVMCQLPHGPAVANDVMDVEAKNIVIAACTLHHKTHEKKRLAAMHLSRQPSRMSWCIGAVWLAQDSLEQLVWPAFSEHHLKALFILLSNAGALL